MRRIAMLVALCAFVVVVPAQADKPLHPGKSDTHKPDTPNHPSNSHKCVQHSAGYNASGTLVSVSLLTQLPDGRYSGSITVNVTRANHKAGTGTTTFTLAETRVKFHHGVDATNPAAGSRVGIHGKIMRLAHGCTPTVFTPTVKKVDIRTAAKP